MYGFVMDFAMNIDKLNLANLVGEVMDEIVEFQIFFTFRKQVVSTCHQCMVFADGQF